MYFNTHNKSQYLDEIQKYNCNLLFLFQYFVEEWRKFGSVIYDLIIFLAIIIFEIAEFFIIFVFIFITAM